MNQPQARYRPPVQRQAPTARRLPPYPVRLVRFPEGLIPGTGRRRGRGRSLSHSLYLMRHPVSLLLGIWVIVIVVAVLAEWVILVVMIWLMWCFMVTVGWLVTLPFATLRR